MDFITLRALNMSWRSGYEYSTTKNFPCVGLQVRDLLSIKI